mmetsp:Transcript_10644/g.36123  ORF Transcript_10644/g.36123 Transcript_10644/m.36123 type:complete len:1006 (-) Transcript_10644:260-3277(-)
MPTAQAADDEARGRRRGRPRPHRAERRRRRAARYVPQPQRHTTPAEGPSHAWARRCGAPATACGRQSMRHARKGCASVHNTAATRAQGAPEDNAARHPRHASAHVHDLVLLLLGEALRLPGRDALLELVVGHQHVLRERRPVEGVRAVAEQMPQDGGPLHDRLGRGQRDRVAHELRGDQAQELVWHLAEVLLHLRLLLLRFAQALDEGLEGLQIGLLEHAVQHLVHRAVEERRVKGPLVGHHGGHEVAPVGAPREVEVDLGDLRQEAPGVEVVLGHVRHLELEAGGPHEAHDKVVEHVGHPVPELLSEERRGHACIRAQVVEHAHNLVGELHEVPALLLGGAELRGAVVAVLLLRGVPGGHVLHLELHLADLGQLAEGLVHAVERVVENKVDEAHKALLSLGDGHDGLAVLRDGPQVLQHLGHVVAVGELVVELRVRARELNVHEELHEVRRQVLPGDGVPREDRSHAVLAEARRRARVLAGHELGEHLREVRAEVRVGHVLWRAEEDHAEGEHEGELLVRERLDLLPVIAPTELERLEGVVHEVLRLAGEELGRGRGEGQLGDHEAHGVRLRGARRLGHGAQVPPEHEQLEAQRGARKGLVVEVRLVAEPRGREVLLLALQLLEARGVLPGLAQAADLLVHAVVLLVEVRQLVRSGHESHVERARRAEEILGDGAEGLRHGEGLRGVGGLRGGRGLRGRRVAQVPLARVLVARVEPVHERVLGCGEPSVLGAVKAVRAEEEGGVDLGDLRGPGVREGLAELEEHVAEVVHEAQGGRVARGLLALAVHLGRALLVGGDSPAQPLKDPGLGLLAAEQVGDDHVHAIAQELGGETQGGQVGLHLVRGALGHAGEELRGHRLRGAARCHQVGDAVGRHARGAEERAEQGLLVGPAVGRGPGGRLGRLPAHGHGDVRGQHGRGHRAPRLEVWVRHKGEAQSLALEERGQLPERPLEVGEDGLPARGRGETREERVRQVVHAALRRRVLRQLGQKARGHLRRDGGGGVRL